MILIADDSSQMRKALKDMLTEFDGSFCECSNGAEAVGMYDSVHPEWVLMDVEMPLMDGITATQRITHRHPEARIVIVSHYDDPILRKDAEAAGAIGYVVKDNLAELERFFLHHKGNNFQ